MLSWRDIIDKYIIKYSNQIQKATKPLQERFGIGYFTYHRIDNAGKYTVLVDRPDWSEHYVSKKIYLKDPYLRNAHVYKSGLCLLENHGSEDYKNNIIKEGKAALDMDLGVLLIEKNEEYVEFFGFAGKSTASCLQNLYVNYPQILRSFAKHFRNEMSPILVQMSDEANSLSVLKGKDFYCKELIYPEVPLEERIAFYNDLGMKQEIKNFQLLSKRERQCLKLLLKGMSAKETASKLNLSARTIESYFENIKNKLSCMSKHELFLLAKNFHDMSLL